MFLEAPEMGGHEIVKGYWGRSIMAPISNPGGGARCTMRGSRLALPTKTPAINGAALATPAHKYRLEGKLEIVFRPDPTIYDGRFANLGWLQELPKPITKITWTTPPS